MRAIVLVGDFIEKLKKRLTSPEEFAERFVRPFQRFAEKEASSSILLLGATTIAILWANSPFSPLYYSLWHTEVSLSVGPYLISKSLLHWINDGMMAFFFFTVGLEIKAEMMVGELASFRRAFLPAAAAFGGMLFPALLFFLLNHGSSAVSGWGIPMATDIAFSLGALAVLGRKLPLGLRAFLSAFAIADDLGAVLVIALFYTKTVVWSYLLVGLVFVLGLAVANFLWVRWTLVYALLGIGLWLAILGSGVHATVAGIVVAMFIPARGKYDTDKFIQEVGALMSEFQCEPSGCGRSILLNQRHLNAVQAIELASHHAETPLQRLEHSLHPWVAFVIIPFFALGNAGMTFDGTGVLHALASPLTLGVALGLLLGKPLGITLFSFLAVKTGLASLPRGVTWSHIAGAGILGGIGFTMSIFVMGLSFDDTLMMDRAKLGILAGSLASAVLGLLFLGIISERKKAE
jgi:NhaA family Na+:H+ antiporter